jgi:hypothetical protein
MSAISPSQKEATLWYTRDYILETSLINVITVSRDLTPEATKRITKEDTKNKSKP